MKIILLAVRLLAGADAFDNSLDQVESARELNRIELLTKMNDDVILSDISMEALTTVARPVVAHQHWKMLHNMFLSLLSGEGGKLPGKKPSVWGEATSLWVVSKLRGCQQDMKDFSKVLGQNATKLDHSDLSFSRNTNTMLIGAETLADYILNAIIVSPYMREPDRYTRAMSAMAPEISMEDFMFSNNIGLDDKKMEQYWLLTNAYEAARESSMVEKLEKMDPRESRDLFLRLTSLNPLTVPLKEGQLAFSAFFEHGEGPIRLSLFGDLSWNLLVDCTWRWLTPIDSLATDFSKEVSLRY